VKIVLVLFVRIVGRNARLQDHPLTIFSQYGQLMDWTMHTGQFAKIITQYFTENRIR